MDNYSDAYVSLKKELSKLENKLEMMPKGTLRRRIINGREYCYLQYRDGDHVRSRYVKPDDISDVCRMIKDRKKTEQSIRVIRSKLDIYSRILGIHRTYRPVKNVNYEDYTLFMSTVAHDYKALSIDVFSEKYDTTKYRGLNKRYLLAFLDYINGIESQNTRKTNDLVLDPYTYLLYYKYGDKTVLEEELKKAIPAFLNRGLLITNVQEAVNGTFDR